MARTPNVKVTLNELYEQVNDLGLAFNHDLTSRILLVDKVGDLLSLSLHRHILHSPKMLHLVLQGSLSRNPLEATNQEGNLVASWEDLDILEILFWNARTLNIEAYAVLVRALEVVGNQGEVICKVWNQLVHVHNREIKQEIGDG